MKATPEGTAAAKKLFAYHCAMCHGADGDGKGDLAGEMKLKRKDWRDPNSLANMTDGELFYIVTNGRGKMTGGEGDRTSEVVRWNLANYVRAFAKKDAATKPSARIPAAVSERPAAMQGALFSWRTTIW